MNYKIVEAERKLHNFNKILDAIFSSKPLLLVPVSDKSKPINLRPLS
jgi:hypothetical protein